jgi:hypothetical protein
LQFAFPQRLYCAQTAPLSIPSDGILGKGLAVFVSLVLMGVLAQVRILFVGLMTDLSYH